MSDGIIDLTQYLRQRDQDDEDASNVFALWGADGERSRFALPLWRTIYLAGGERGAIVWNDPVDPDHLRPFVVLDLAQDPPRRSFEAPRPGTWSGEETPPAVHDLGAGGLYILLGRRENRSWYLVIDGGEGREAPVRGRDREDILFLAGECAGLLFLRDFADEA